MRVRSIANFALVGYAVDAVVGAVAYRLGGLGLALVAAHLVNILLLFWVIGCGIVHLIRRFRARRAAPLGTYANSDSRPRMGGASRPPGATR